MVSEFCCNERGLRFRVEMPITYKNGVERQITKNSMTTIYKDWRGGVRVMRNKDLMRWYEWLEVLGMRAELKEGIDKWKKQNDDKYGKNKWKVEINIYWYLKSGRTDCHNYNMILLDGLQKFLDVNDRGFFPKTCGMKVINKKDGGKNCTNARVLLIAKESDSWGEVNFLAGYFGNVWEAMRG